MHARHRVIRVLLAADLEQGRVALLLAHEELRYRLLGRAFAAGHEQHTDHLERVADGEAERAADQYIDLLHARELDEVGRRGAAHLRHVLADRLTALGRDDEHLFAGAEVGRDLTFVECYADVHNRPSTVESAPESASGSFASSILPASTASASFGSIGSLARTGSS